MGGFIRRVISWLAAALLLFAAGCGPMVDARKMEEIRGTYALKNYYVTEGGNKTTFKDRFEYFYLVVADGAALRCVYKLSDEEEYSASEYSYVCKYQTGSDENIEELKFRFEMPVSPVEEGLVVNYLTVTGDDLLACQKIIYSAASEHGRPSVWKQIFITFEKISGETDLSFVESKVGHAVEING